MVEIIDVVCLIVVVVSGCVVGPVVVVLLIVVVVSGCVVGSVVVVLLIVVVVPVVLLVQLL